MAALNAKVNPDSVSNAVDSSTGEPAIFIHSGNPGFTHIDPNYGEFGGIFVLEGESAQYRPSEYKLFMRGPTADTRDISSFFFNAPDNGKSVVEDALGRELTEEELEIVSDAVIEEGWVGDDFTDALGIDADDMSTEYQTMQSIRGAVALAAGYTSVEIYDEFSGDSVLVVDPLAIKSATDNVGTFSAETDDIRFSRHTRRRAADFVEGIGRKIDERGNRKRTMPEGLTPERQAAGKFDTFAPRQPITDRIKAFRQVTGKVLHQKIFDQYAAIGEYSRKGFMQAHLAKGSETTVEAAIKHGAPVLRDGAMAIDTWGESLMDAFSKSCCSTGSRTLQGLLARWGQYGRFRVCPLMGEPKPGFYWQA